MDVSVPCAEGYSPGGEEDVEAVEKIPCAPEECAEGGQKGDMGLGSQGHLGEGRSAASGKNEGPVGRKGGQQGKKENVQKPGVNKFPEGEAEDIEPRIVAEDGVGGSEGRAVEKSEDHGPFRGYGRPVRHAEEDRSPENAEADQP